MGKVVSRSGTFAKVRFLDSSEVREVDVSMVKARKGSYVEVFAALAIGCVTKREAELKRSLRLELMRRAGGS